MNDSLLYTSSSHRANVKQVSKKLKKFARIKNKTGEEDIKDYAATTMNELLGWFGYDKFDSRDTQSLQLASTSSDDSASPNSPNTESRPSKIAADGESTSCDRVSIDVEENSSEPVDTSCRSPNEPMTEDHNSKESNEDATNVPAGYILCAWCQKVGMKLFTLRTTNGCKAFCSELCFTQCRRASFKKNKVCDWCKHVRHTVNYVDFHDGEQQLQFCSDKCLNQYKMNIFCEETQAQLQLHPQLQESSAKFANSSSDALITPDLWMRDCKRDESNEYQISDCRGSDHSDTEQEQQQEWAAACISMKRKVMEPINNKNGNSKETVINFTRREKERESKRQKHSPYSNGNNENSRRFAAKETKDLSSTGNQNQNHVGLMHYKPMSALPSRNAAALQRMSNLAASSHVPLPSPIGAPMPHSAFSSPSSAPTVNSYFGSLSASRAASREHIRPLISPAFVPSHLENSYTEMLRMQRGIRNPFPRFVNNHPIPGQPFAGIHRIRPTNLTRHPHPLQPTFPHPYYQPNSHVMPPVTVMVPCPFFWPVPVPFPVPFPIPIRKECEHNSTDFGVQVNADSFKEKFRPKSTTINGGSNNSDTSSIRKVDSLLTRLVEKTNKTNAMHELNPINMRPNLCSMDSGTRQNQPTDNYESPQNLMIASRVNRQRETQSQSLN